MGTAVKQSKSKKEGIPQIVKFETTPSSLKDRLVSNRIHSAVSALASSSSPVSETDDFFHECVKNLSKAFGVKYAFIGVFEDETKSSIRSLAVSTDLKITENISYDLKGTPCEDCLNQQQVLIQEDVAEKYPEDDMLAEMELQSYFGSSIIDSNGHELGLVVILDTKPMAKDEWMYPIFALFADRISLELERINRQKDLRLAASVFENSREGIMLLDTDWKIRKANKAFSNISGWNEDEIIGLPVTKLATKDQTDFSICEISKRLAEQDHWENEIWSHQKNGGIYPEKRTISAVRDPQTKEVIHYISMTVDISEQKYAEQRINRLAKYDQITELPNRNYFNEKLNENISIARKQNTDLALMTLDLDGFKLINDMRGHQTGDRLLKLMGERLQYLPTNEIFCARIGGDEFTLLFNFNKKQDNLEAILNDRAEEIIDLVSHPYMLDGEETVITASIGIAIFSDESNDAQSLIQNSDQALYVAKKKGKNCFEYYKPEYSSNVENQFALTNLLRKALAKNQFEIHYQSKNKAKSHEIVGYEALIRWKLDDGVLVSPGQFIPVAEDSGMITEIGKWVIKEVFNQTKIWDHKGFHFGRISINISGRQLSDDKFVQWMKELIQETKTNPQYYELEITESWLIEDPDKSANVLTQLHDLGFHLSIDDFGVAHSSLNYLKCFPVDTIKIDRSFTRDITTSEESMAIISAIIAIGNNLNLNILAEGVETKEQLEKLESAGCNEIQGFYFSKPQPVNILEMAQRELQNSSEEFQAPHSISA